MRHFEINGNLENEINLDFELFCSTVSKIRNYYIIEFGQELMDSIDLYVDNATSGTGYAPVATPILGKYVIIKLNIGYKDTGSKIAFQFSHELMHYVFFAKKGIGKAKADEGEEAICTAASLIIIKEFFSIEFNLFNTHVKGLLNKGYQRGAEIAESVNYNFQNLQKLI